MLYEGLQSAGQNIAGGLEKAAATKVESEFLDGLGSYYFKEDPEAYQKYLNSSLGKKRGMVTAAQAQEAAQNRDEQMGLQRRGQDLSWAKHEDDSAFNYYDLDTKSKEAEKTRTHQTRQWEATKELNVPQPFASEAGTGVYNQNTGTFQVTGKPGAEAPNGVESEEIKGPDGKPAYIRKWNPQKGAYDDYDLRPKGGGMDAWAQMLAGGAPSIIPSGTPAPVQTPALTATAPKANGQFQPGKVYRDAKGNRARYNADGSWSPVR